MRGKMTLRALSLLFSIIFLSASAAGAAVDYKVRKGDCLSGIAKRHKVSVRDIERANPGVAANLRAGFTIVIPSREAAVKKNRKTDRAAGDARAAGKSGRADKRHPALAERKAGDSYHTVKKGETLSSLAKKYSVSVSALKGMNNLKSSKLKRGQKLLVKQAGPKTYVVRKGDAVAEIAKKFDMDADDLMEINDLASPDVKAGQQLSLEEEADDGIAENYREVAAEKIEEEIKEVSESEEFADKNLRDKLIIFAKKMLNIPYKFGGSSSMMGIDCSAYVKKVYGLLGIDLPRTARQQFAEGEAIDKDKLSIGDLVFFRTYAPFPSHVGIYLGNNLFIHASSQGKKVTIDSLETPYYLKRFIGGKRLLTDQGQDPAAEIPLGG
jgi:peptidoglycan endopeptidase LytE